jgi:hypothetical protein
MTRKHEGNSNETRSGIVLGERGQAVATIPIVTEAPADVSPAQRNLWSCDVLFA